MSVDVKTWKKINVLLSLCFGGVGKKKKFFSFSLCVSFLAIFVDVWSS
jgi:hypothetical protein